MYFGQTGPRAPGMKSLLAWEEGGAEANSKDPPCARFLGALRGGIWPPGSLSYSV